MESIMSKKATAFRMSPIAQAACALVVLAGGMASPGLAVAGLTFTQQPPLDSSALGGLPNIIIAIDQTGSMTVPDATCTGQSTITSGGKTYYLGGTNSQTWDPDNYLMWDDYPLTQCPAGGGMESRMYAVQDALFSVFSQPALLGKFRLAFEGTATDAGFGPNRFYPSPSTPDNSMRLFDSAYQAQFLDWVSKLTSFSKENYSEYYAGCNPTEPMIAYAGEYLKGYILDKQGSVSINSTDGASTANFSSNNDFSCQLNGTLVPLDALVKTMPAGVQKPAVSTLMPFTATDPTGGAAQISSSSPDPRNYLHFTPIPSGLNNPWDHTQDLGTGKQTDANSRLACRRASFIYLTDGGVNGNSFSVQDVLQGETSSTFSGALNQDTYAAVTRTLPDTVHQYDPNQPYGKLYGDKWSATNSNLALYYWATNLTNRSPTAVAPLNNVADPQTFTYTYPGSASPYEMPASYSPPGGSLSVTYDTYWNPQNDPATWQHMQTFTIGFGQLTNGGGGQVFPCSSASTLTSTAGSGGIGGGALSQWCVDNAGVFAAGNPIVMPTGFIDTNHILTDPYGYDPTTGLVVDYGNFFSMMATGAFSQVNTSLPLNGYQWPQPVLYDNVYSYLGMGLDLDLIHMAYNGRGQYYPGTSTDSLKNAFQKIIAKAVVESTAGAIASAAASGGVLNNGSVAYVASYSYSSTAGAFNPTSYWGTPSAGAITGNINGWGGSVLSFPGDQIVTEATATPLWAASIPVARNIFTTDQTLNGVPFAWATPNGISGDPSGIQQNDVNAVRANPLGDVINSQMFLVGNSPNLNASSTRTNVLYVGANDGMLHGFDAGDGTSATPGTGKELMAYVPRGLFSNLHTNTFASSSYIHQSWVDGSPFAGDAQTANLSSSTPTWSTVLVGTLGAGGPGYFVLDVSDPGTFGASNVLLDATDPSQSQSPLATTKILNNDNGTYNSSADPATAGALQTLGNQFSQAVMDLYNVTQSAQIVRLNSNDTSHGGIEWGAIMGNGYNSLSGVPTLLIQSLSKEKGYPLYAIAVPSVAGQITWVADGNGLGAPRPVDADGNGTADIVYAGDLEGNLWKFDISSWDHSKWKVVPYASGSSTTAAPMFRAVGPSGVPQPITSAPVAVPNANGGFMVGFGTGKNLTDADTGDANLNTFYVLYDGQKMTASVAPIDGSALASATASTLQASQVVLTDNSADNAFCTAAGVPGGGAARYGCLYSNTGGDTGGVLDTTTDYSGVSVVSGSTLQTGATPITPLTTLTGGKAETGNGVYRGWYFDIPLSDDLSVPAGFQTAGKVLANPILMANNTVMFYSQNVATNQSVNSVGDESCDPVTVTPPATTLNFFNLFTSLPPDNVTVVLNGVTNIYNNALGSDLRGNRFQQHGVTTYLRNGNNTVVGVSGGQYSVGFNPPGKPLGWHLGR